MSSDVDEDVYEVERIVAEDVVDGETFYLVKWKDYPDEQCTWEPAANFSQEETLKEWHKLLTSGDTLDAEQVSILQQKMDRWKEQQYQSDYDDDNYSEEALHSHRMPNKRRKLSVDSDPHPRVGEMSSDTPPPETLSKKKEAVVPVPPKPVEPPKSFHGISDPQQARRISNADTSRPIAKSGIRPGQLFRNFRHMNNAQKARKNEPVPSRPLVTKTPEEWAASAPHDIAHNLPPVSSTQSESIHWLFLPESSKPETTEVTSLSNAGSANQSGPPVESILQPGVRESSRESGAKSNDSQNVINSDKLMTGYDGKQQRTWFKGDILVKIIFGEQIIGEVKLLHLPWEYGKVLLEFKEEGVVPLHFSLADVVDRPRYDFISRQSWFSYLAVSSIEAFPDTETALKTLATRLEKDDIAGLLDHPHRDLTMIMYSCHSPRWRDIGAKPVRTGESRLHIAFRQKPQMIFSNQEMTTHRDQEAGQGSRSPGKQSNIPKSVALSAKIASPRPENSPGTGASNSALATVQKSPRANLHVRERSLSHSSQSRPSNRTNSETSSSSLNLTLNYKQLIHVGNMPAASSVNSARACFYITFASRLPEKAKAVREFLQLNPQTKMILDDSNDEYWPKFCMYVSTYVCVVLFHHSYPCWHKMPKLAKCLQHENVLCWNLSSGNNSHQPQSAMVTERIFPRGTVILLTEGSILTELKSSIYIVNWFKRHSSKNGGKLILRPRIRDWLKTKAAQNSKQQNDLTDLLTLLYSMMSSSKGPCLEWDGNESGFGVASDTSDASCIISPLWDDGYKGISQVDDLSGEVTVVLSKDHALETYYSSWAMARVNRYRRFIAFGIGAGISGNGHVLLQNPKTFADKETLRSKQLK